MDVVGSEIGQKMRSAIKAKLTELGCYVDDELPDYVMVMVANKRTRAQMEDDLQLFLGDNTESFVNWLHQVLKKLQEVTIAAPLIQVDVEKSKEKSKPKEKKSKDKKDKSKKDKFKLEAVKKAKKKSKEKALRKKEEKKLHKSKKKSKHHELIRPNVPPLLMNIEKESEPSITDVFAGQILKNHGITIESPKEIEIIEQKPIIKETKRPILPIIDPATISSHTDISEVDTNSQNTMSEASIADPIRNEQIQEMYDIEAKIQGLKQKLVEQLDTMSDDEDFLNIRTEAEELMNDFADDVYQEVSQPRPVTPPSQPKKAVSPPKQIHEPTQIIQNPEETLPQIELRLPKRPIRERLGFREEQRKIEEWQKEKRLNKSESPERFTPERDPDVRAQTKSAKSRLGEPLDSKRKSSQSEDSDQEANPKRLTSRVSVQDSRSSRFASIVRVRPRPRVAPNSSLLLKAMADAHKSLLNIPPKVDTEPTKVKRALVHPMRRCTDASNIVIQVQGDRQTDLSDTVSQGEDSEEDKLSKSITNDPEKKEYAPALLKKVITNTEYVPFNRRERVASCHDDTLIVETINIHNPTIDRDKNTKFIVTMDGFNPNAFLAKKLMTEGILDENDALTSPKNKTESVLKIKEVNDKDSKQNTEADNSRSVGKVQITPTIQKKRLSDTSEESDTQVIIKNDEENDKQSQKETGKRRTVELGKAKKRKSEISDETKITEDSDVIFQSKSEVNKDVDTVKRVKEEKGESVKKRRASPIVFDVKRKEESKRERTDSASSDNHVTVTTTPTAKKYDTLPPLDKAAIAQKPASVWCRSFPLCRYGASCAFAHPRCKFAAACTRRGCVYSHALVPQAQPQPAISSQVVPAANFKSISPAALPSLCKFYPNCVNPSCHYYHPKLCRYGKSCMNKLECNFYHNDIPVTQFKYPG